MHGSCCILCYTMCFVVLCGFENWPSTSRKEHRLRVFENRVLTEVFGPKMTGNKGIEKTT